MKKAYFLLAALAIAVSFSSCDKAAALLFKPFESPLNFDVSVAPVAAGTSATLGSTVVNYDLNTEVSNATSGAFKGDIITQMYVDQIAITLSNTDASNSFANFESVSLQVTSGSATPVVLGPFTIPSNAVSSIDITVTNSPNIRQYFNGSNVTFSLIGKTKTATTKTLAAHIGATIKFDK